MLIPRVVPPQNLRTNDPMGDIPLWLSQIGQGIGDYWTGLTKKFNPTPEQLAEMRRQQEAEIVDKERQQRIFLQNLQSIPSRLGEVGQTVSKWPSDIAQWAQESAKFSQEVPLWQRIASGGVPIPEALKLMGDVGEPFMKTLESAWSASPAFGKDIRPISGPSEMGLEEYKEKINPRVEGWLGDLGITKLGLAGTLGDPTNLLFGAGGVSKITKVNILDDVVKALSKGIKPEVLLKTLMESPITKVKMGYNPLLSEAENLIKTAEAKISQLGKVTPTVAKGTTVYRSSKTPFNKNLMGEEGVFVTTEKSMAESWQTAQKGYGVPEKLVISDDAKILKFEDIPKRFFTKDIITLTDAEKVAQYAKAQGYDGWENIGSSGAKEIQIWNKSKISIPTPTPPVTKGAGVLPSEAERAFKGAGGTVPPNIPPSVPPNVVQQVGNIPPSDTNFLEYLKNIVKPSRKTFEVGESAQRGRQAAAYKAAFEAAGGGEKGHLAGRAAQKGALKPSVEPFNAPQGWWDNHVNTMDQFQLVDGLGKPRPIGFDNATMKGAFLRLKQGVLPQPMELDYLEQYFGKGSMDTLKELIKPSWTEYPITWFYNSILSGPKTQIVNFGSNTLRGILSPFESGAAALVEAPLAFLQGRPRERFFGEAAQELFGLIRGLPEGSRSFVNTFISGKSLGKWELKGQVMTGKKWIPITWPTHLLEAADAFGFAIHSATSIRTQAFRIASAEKLKGQAFLSRLNGLVNNPTADMMAIAEKVADYRLFRQKPGTIIGKLIEIRNQAWPIRFLVPFLRTPANLVKYGLELSPLGILNPKLWKNLASKSPEAAEQIGRWVIGSGVAISFGLYAADGNITGAAPVDPTKRDAFYRAGKQPYSLKIGDTWVSYQRLEPFNQLLSQVAAVVDSIQEGKTTKDAFEIAQGIISTIGNNLISQTYMENIANVMNFIEDPFGEGKRLLQRTASGFVPESALLRTIAQALDPTIRQAQNIPEQIMAGIPGLTEQIRAKTNVFGETQKRETPSYSPINITSEKNDPVNIELDRLGLNVGLVGGTITFTNASGKSEKLVLTGDELYNYRNLSGQAIKRALDKAVASAAYRRLQTDERRESYLNNVISDARQDAREMQLNNSGIPTPDRQERLQRLAAEEILQPYFEIEDEMWRGQEQLLEISKEINKLKNSSNPRDNLKGAQMEVKNPRILFIREQIVMKQQMMLSNPKMYKAMKIYRGRE